MTLQERLDTLDSDRQRMEARINMLNQVIGKAREEGNQLVTERLKCVAKIEQLRELMGEYNANKEEQKEMSERHKTIATDEEEG